MTEEEKKIVEEKKVVSVSEYRQKIGAIKAVVLPSGVTFKVKKLTVMDYIKRGLSDIPNDFFKFIAELSTGLIENPQSDEAKKNYNLFEKFLKITIEYGVVEPLTLLRYDKEKEDTHLVFAELPEEDQEFLINTISGKK